MKIELLYFEGCPNHEVARDNLRKAMAELDINAKIEVIEVLNNDEAAEKRFLGSPSIRLNGRDIEGADGGDASYSMRCRRYQYGSEILGYPPKETILAALKSAMARGANHD